MPDDAYFEVAGGVRRLYPQELLADILEMPGLAEEEFFAASDHDPQLYRIMSQRLTGGVDDLRPGLLRQVKAAIGREIGLCMEHDYPMVPSGDKLSCDKCAELYGARLVQLVAAVPASV